MGDIYKLYLIKLYKQKVDIDKDMDVIKRGRVRERCKEREYVSLKNLLGYKPSIIFISGKLYKDICFIVIITCFIAPKFVTVDKIWG